MKHQTSFFITVLVMIIVFFFTINFDLQAQETRDTIRYRVQLNGDGTIKNVDELTQLIKGLKKDLIVCIEVQADSSFIQLNDQLFLEFIQGRLEKTLEANAIEIRRLDRIRQNINYKTNDKINYIESIRRVLLDEQETRVIQEHIDRVQKKLQSDTYIPSSDSLISYLYSLVRAKQLDKNFDKNFIKDFSALLKFPYEVEIYQNGKWEKIDDQKGGNTSLPDLRKICFSVQQSVDIPIRFVKVDLIKWYVLEYLKWAEKEMTNSADFLSLLTDFTLKQKIFRENSSYYDAKRNGGLIQSILHLPMDTFLNLSDTCCLPKFRKCVIESLLCHFKWINGALKISNHGLDWIKNNWFFSGGMWVMSPLSLTSEQRHLDPLIASSPFTQLNDTLYDYLENRKRYRDLITVKSVINRTSVRSLPKYPLFQLRNYDLSRNPLIDKSGFESGYPEDFKLLLAGHNIPKDINLKVGISTSKYEEKSIFTTILEKPLDEYLKSQGLFLSGKNSESSAATSNKSNLFEGSDKTTEKILIDTSCCTSRDLIKISAAHPLVRELYDELQVFDVHQMFYQSLLPPGNYRLLLDTAPQFRSEWLPFEKPEAPITIKYHLIAKKTFSKDESIIDTVETSSFKLGKRQRIVLAAGYTYTFGSVVQTLVKRDANNNIVTGIENVDERYKAVLGLKFQLGRGLWISDDQLLTPKYGSMLDRTSVFLGLLIDKNPFKNIFLGIGYDVIPGLNINMGIHIYNNRSYQIVNNQVVAESSRYFTQFPYAGICIDPGLLIKFISIAGKKF